MSHRFPGRDLSLLNELSQPRKDSKTHREACARLDLIQKTTASCSIAFLKQERRHEKRYSGSAQETESIPVTEYFNIPSSSPTDPSIELLCHSDSEYPETRNTGNLRTLNKCHAQTPGLSEVARSEEVKRR